MAYLPDIREVVTANVDEIRGDLDRTRVALRHARSEVSELERRVASFEGLLELIDQTSVTSGDGSGMTLHAAMVHVLRSSPDGMLRAGDLAAEIDRSGLYKMRDGRPVESQQIHARVGNYPHLFTKVGTFIKLVADTDE